METGAFSRILLLSILARGIYVFETANSWTGSFSSIANGDYGCTLSSQAASGTRFYNVPVLSFLSSSSVNAISRFAGLKYPVYMGDGTFAASSMTALLSTNLGGRIIGQSGAATTAGFWTGTTQTGVYSGADCNDWSSTYIQQGTIGSSLGGASWANYQTADCQCFYCLNAATYSLLCMQYDYAAPGSIATGIHVFQTSNLYNGSLGGISGADAKCNAEAAGFPALTGRTFRALLTTSNALASSRIQPGKPLLGIDGVTLGASVAATSLPYTIATGTATIPNTHFWLGSSSTCSDWTSGSAGIKGADATSSIWLTGTPITIFCNTLRPLICIESLSPCVVNPCDYAPPYCKERGDFFGRTCSCPPGKVGSGEQGQCVSLVYNSFSVTSGATIVSPKQVLLANTAGGSVFTVIVALSGTGKNATAPANVWTFAMKLTNGAFSPVLCTALTNAVISLSAANTDTVTLTCTLGPGGGLSWAAMVTGCVVFSGSSTQYCTTLNTTVMFNYPPPTITSGTIRRDIYSTGSTFYQALAAGGTIVFEGTNFQQNMMQVWLGKTGNLLQYACQLSSLTNATLVYCFPDPGSGTNVFTVIVGSQSVTGIDTYSYPVLPSITMVSGCSTPNGQGTANCPTIGGVTLQVFGTSFLGNVTVIVDMKSCANVVTNGTWISCLLPPGTGVGKAILVNSLNTLSAPQNFISYAPPTVNTLSVDAGCTQGANNKSLIDCDRTGGARLTITGHNFGSSGASVQIGAVPCVNSRNEGTLDTVVTCTLPPGNSANQPIILSVLGGGTVTTGSISYTACLVGTQQDPTNQTICESCPKGYANNQVGGSCTACETGKYTNSVGQDSCTTCPAGSCQNATGSSICSQCLVGRYSIVDGQVSCLACDIGSYTSSLGQTSCFLCPQGMYQNAPGMSFCSVCQPGMYSPVTGQATCLPCDIGKYGNVTGLTECPLCPQGTSQPQPGESACVACLGGTYSDTGGQQSCSPCELGKYGDGTTPCQPCPSGTFQNMSSQTGCWNCPTGRASNSPGQVACLACDLGYFAPQEGLQTCNKCDKGFYQDIVQATSCVECDTGKYTDSEAQFQCKDCGPGAFANETAMTVCNLCAAGTFQKSPRATICPLCPVGSYTSYPGQAECQLCAPGAFNIVEGRSTCDSCPVGRYQASNGESFCSACEPGKYAATTTACTLCPSTEIAVGGVCLPCPLGIPASLDRTRCECPQGSYMDKSAHCAVCAEGLACSIEGLTESDLTTEVGWWRSSKESVTPIRCINAANCASNDTCTAHRTGLLCSECVPGYRSSYIGGPCLFCASHSKAAANTAGILIAVGIALIVIYVIVLRQTKYLDVQLREGNVGNNSDLSATFVANKLKMTKAPSFRSTNAQSVSGSNSSAAIPTGSNRQSAILGKPMDWQANLSMGGRNPNFISQFKIFIGFLQVLLAIVHHGDLTWPTAFAQMLNVLSFINFDFVPWQSLTCAVPMDGLTQAIVVCIIPLVALLLAIPVPLVLRLIDKFDFSDSDENRIRRGVALGKFTRIFLFTCFLFYPHVSSVVMGVYNCRNVEGILYLKTDSTILCNSPQWRSRALPLVMAVFVYPFGIPAMCFYFLYRNRGKLNEPTTLLAFGSLYEPYCKDFWWFEVIDMLYKMTMTSLVIFARTANQLSFALGLTGVYLMLLLVSDPYKRLADYRLHSFLLADILVLLVFAVTLQQAGPLSELTDGLLSAFLITLVVLMMVFFVMVVVTTMKGTIYSWVRGHRLKQARDTMQERSMVSQEGLGHESIRPNESGQINPNTSGMINGSGLISANHSGLINGNGSGLIANGSGMVR